MNPKGLKSAPKIAPEKMGLKRDKEIFSKEMRVQVHRIESVLKIKDSESLKRVAREKLKYDVFSNPMLFVFLDAYKDKEKLKNLINDVDDLKKQREKLLHSVRKLIYKAKVKEKEKIKEEKKVEKIEKEVAKSIDKMSASEILSIEDEVRNPFELSEEAIKKGEVKFETFQNHYKKIFNAQRLLAHNIKSFSENFEDATKKLKKHNKKNKGWKSHVFGLYYWAKSKISSADKKKKKRANEAIAKARKYYKENLARGKELKENIKNRSQELKVALNLYKMNVRERLKKMISKKDWTKEREKKSKGLKEKFSNSKVTLLEGLESAKQTAKEITEAQKLNQNLKGTLKEKYDNISASEYTISRRIDDIRNFAAKVKEKFPEGDPRREKALRMVEYVKDRVLSPLSNRKSELENKKIEAKMQYLKSAEGGIKMDILKADTFLQKKELLKNLDKVELGIQTETAKIERLSKTREKLLEEIERGETFYMVTDEFKESMWKNLDKVIEQNNKVFGALDKQYDYLKKAKATDRGFFTSLYNTVGVGKFGLLSPLYVTNNMSRIPALVYNTFANWDEWEGWDGFVEQWDGTEKWSFTGMLGQAAEGVNRWIEKGGVRQYEWFKKGYVAKPLGYLINFFAGVGSGALDIVHGAGTLVFKPWEVADGIVDLVTSWSKTKEALKQVIHYHHWDEGRYGIAAGKSATDILALLLSGGVGAGMKSAKAAGTVGRLAKVAAFMRGFGRYAIMRFKAVPGMIKSLPVAVWRKLANAKNIVKGVATGKGLSVYRKAKIDVINNKAHKAAEKVAKKIDDFKGKKLEILDAETRKIFNKIEKSDSTVQGIKSLSSDEFTKLLKGLDREFMATKSVRIQAALDNIGYSLKEYLKLRAKQQVVKTLTTEDLVKRTDDLIKKETPKSVSERAKLAYKTKKAIDDIDELLETASEKNKNLLKARKTKLSKKFDDIRNGLNVNENLSVYDVIKIYERADEVTGVKPRVLQLWQKRKLKGAIKDQIDLLMRKKVKITNKAMKEILEDRISTLTQELQKVRYFDMVEISRLLKVNKIKEALDRLRTLDYAAMPKNIAKSVLKLVFVKYPLVSAYISRVEDLWDPKLVERIPKEKLKSSKEKEKIEEIRNEFIKQVTDYYKVKPSSKTKK